MIDLHCHLLPGIDDGPADMDGSLALARAAVAAGTTTIAATPHVSGRYPNDPETIGEGVAAVREALRAEGIVLQVLPAAEIALERLVDMTPATIAALTIGAGRYALVECPHGHVPGAFDQAVTGLLRSGVRPILAHPERSRALVADRRRLEILVGRGALCSLTAASVAGRLGAGIERVCMEMIRDGLAHNVASDAHDVRRRTPDLRLATERLGRLGEAGRAWAGWLTREVPRAVVEDRDPPPPPPPLPRPSRWGGLLGRGAGRG